MLDGVSLDQLRAFIASADEGSFSAAARKLHRAQSVVSELVSNLEGQIGVTLFDRSGRYPVLTPQGAVLLADARSISSGLDFMKARAKGMASGLEPELSVVVDVLFPIAAITEAAKEFREKFPGTPLRLYVEALGAAYQPVLDGIAGFGIVGSLPLLPSGLTAERLTGVSDGAWSRPAIILSPNTKASSRNPNSPSMCSWFSPTARACRKGGSSA